MRVVGLFAALLLCAIPSLACSHEESSESTGEFCPGGWTTGIRSDFCYCLETDRTIPCADAALKTHRAVSREGGIWQGSENGAYVFDVGQEPVWFESESPRLLRVSTAMILDVSVTRDGRVLCRDKHIGYVAGVSGIDKRPVAALVDTDGRLLDLAHENGALVIRATSILPAFVAGSLATSVLPLAPESETMDADVAPALVPLRRADVEVNTDVTSMTVVRSFVLE